MKKNLLFIILILIAIYSFAWDVPPFEYISDNANVFTEEEIKEMYNKVKPLYDNTGIQIAILTVFKNDSITPKDMATQTFNEWKLGKKGEDKGILILFAFDESFKAGTTRIEIETGYGVEGDLPDGKVGRILDSYTVPEIKNKNYGLAALKTIDAITNIVNGTTYGDKSYNDEEEIIFNINGKDYTTKDIPDLFKKSPIIGILISIFIFFIIILFIIAVVISSVRRRRYGRGNGFDIMDFFFIIIEIFKIFGRGGGGGGFGGFGGGDSGGGGSSGGGGAGRDA